MVTFCVLYSFEIYESLQISNLFNNSNRSLLAPTVVVYKAGLIIKTSSYMAFKLHNSDRKIATTVCEIDTAEQVLSQLAEMPTLTVN